MLAMEGAGDGLAAVIIDAIAEMSFEFVYCRAASATDALIQTTLLSRDVDVDVDSGPHAAAL